MSDEVIAYTPMPWVKQYECPACGAKLHIYEYGDDCDNVRLQARDERIAEHDAVCPKKPRGNRRR